MEFSRKMKKQKMIQPRLVKTVFVGVQRGSSFRGFHVGVLYGQDGRSTVLGFWVSVAVYVWDWVVCKGGILLCVGIEVAEDVLFLVVNYAVLNTCYVAFLFHFIACLTHC